MAIRIWSDKFSSGIVDIDERNQSLFLLINKYEEENDEKADTGAAIALLEEILSYCREHFKMESGLMETSSFPLADYHEGFHSAYMEKTEELVAALRDGAEKEPYYKVVEAAIELQHHIVRDDLTIFYHRKNKDAKIDKKIVGGHCELFTISNEHLGYGTILSVDGDDIEIQCKNKAMLHWHGDVVKVTLFTKSFEFLCFAAKVHGTKDGLLRLFSSTVIKTVNDREYFRIPTKIDATIWRYEDGDYDFEYDNLISESKPQIGVTIIDIGAGGVLVEAAPELSDGEKVKIRFSFHGNDFLERCQVVRSLKREAALHHYGMKFIMTTPFSHDRLVRELLKLQAAHMKEARRAEGNS